LAYIEAAGSPCVLSIVLVPFLDDFSRLGRGRSKGFADWGELLGDAVIATAVLDRLLHHSHVINIRGESYRLKDKRQSGLLTSSRLLTSTSEETQMER